MSGTVESKRVKENEVEISLQKGSSGRSQENIQDEVTASKKKKARKPQTAEEFEAQKGMFLDQGPTVNAQNWLYEDERLKQLNVGQKQDRMQMLHACERAYFQKDYDKCLQLVQIGEMVFGIEDADEDGIGRIEETFNASGRKTRKSAKVERHVLDLQHIKKKCREKLQDTS